MSKEFHFFKMKRVLEIVCTTMWMYLTLPNYIHLKIIKMVIFMLYIFLPQLNFFNCFNLKKAKQSSFKLTEVVSRYEGNRTLCLALLSPDIMSGRATWNSSRGLWWGLLSYEDLKDVKNLQVSEDGPIE